MSGPGTVINHLEYVASIPDTVATCQNVKIGWTGGVPPYVVSYSPVNVPNIITIISRQSSDDPVNWPVSAPNFAVIVLNVADSLGTAIHSPSISVNGGQGTSCTDFNGTDAITLTSSSTESKSTITTTPTVTAKQTSQSGITTRSLSSTSGTGTPTLSSSLNASSSSSSSITSLAPGSTPNINASTTADSSSISPSITDGAVSSINSLPQDGDSSKTPLGAIVAGVVGGILVVIVIILLLFCRRRRRNKQTFNDNPEGSNSNGVIQPFRRDSMIQAPMYFGHVPITKGRGQPGSFPSIPVIPTSNLNSLINNSKFASDPTSPSIPNSDSNQNQNTETQTGLGLGSEPPVSPDENTSNPSQDGAPDSVPQIMRHKDSGIRIPAAGMVELPPLYTPS